MQQLAEYALDLAAQLKAQYADVRYLEQEQQEIVTKEQAVARLSRTASRGIGVRVLVRGGWGFASTQTLTKAGVAAAVKLAVDAGLASASCRDSPVQLAPEPAWNATWISPHLIDPFTISIEEKVGLLLEASRIMLGVKGVTLTQGYMSFTREEKLFLSSEGSRIKQTFIRSSCGIEAHATGKDDRQRRSWPTSFGGQHETAGWEMVLRWDLLGNAQRIAEEAVALLSAPACPQTTTDVILGGSQLGLQIHESMGHPSELDRSLGWEINFAGASFLTPDQLGKLRYGSELVNLVADATASGALGSFGFDDEGVQARCTPLVTDGLFTGFLSSRETASLIGLDRSGGMMRAESWNFTPIIRMTNISLLPGNAGTLDDIIADTDDGILMETNRSWSIDQLRYQFQFSTEAGWEIKKGRRGRLLKNCSYAGITTSFWNSCDAIGDRRAYVDWGIPNCGKGQPMQTMWTGHGAAPARFRNVTVGIAHAG
jgi:TldD protein